MSLRQSILVGLVLLLPSCVSGASERREENRRQLETFLEVQDRQNRIEAYVRSLPPVEAVTAYLRPDSVVVRMHLKPGVSLSVAEQDTVNRFITELTGIPREGIVLAVPESSVPGLRREE